jgi:endonuclease/exonuclease/phosphatase family metal-dependent hydrolase
MIPDRRLRACAATIGAVLMSGACVARVPRTFDPDRLAELSCRQPPSPGDPVPIWIEPSDLTNRFRLSRWCQTVGPVLFRARPAVESAAAVDRVAIVSWNIHEGEGDVSELIRRLRAGEFSGGTPVGEFVLLLQEATRRSRAVPSHIPRRSPVPGRITPRAGAPDRDIQRFADEGFAVLYAPSMRNGEVHDREESDDAEDRGNAIISTLRLEDPHVIELPLERQRRVAAAATVAGHNSRGAAWELEIVDVHLDTAVALFHGGPFAARRRQAGALVGALRTLDQSSHGTRTTVVGGDLNTWRGRRESAVRLLADAFPDTSTTENVPTWRGPLGLHARLDHIFVGGASRRVDAIRLPSRFGSDHYPLLAILDLGLN